MNPEIYSKTEKNSLCGHFSRSNTHGNCYANSDPLIVFIKSIFSLTEFVEAAPKNYSQKYVSVKIGKKNLKNTCNETHLSNKHEGLNDLI